MKRLLILLLCSAFLLWGCGTGEPKLEDPVTVYYPRTEYIFGQSDSVIASGSMEAEGFKTDLTALLNAYLQGPGPEGLRNPFPADSLVMQLQLEDTVLTLDMNDGFSTLTGAELTLACACLAKTALSLSAAQTVQITLDSDLPDTRRIITMDAKNLLLMDDIITTTPTENQEGL